VLLSMQTGTSRHQLGAEPLRLKPFLDQPQHYSEHSCLIATSGIFHSLALFWHGHRTACLIAALALQWVFSSQVDPLALAALQAHFAGAGSAALTAAQGAALVALPCLLPQTWLSLAPVAAAWTLAHQRARAERWGVASGLWVSLLITCWVMKTVSYLALPRAVYTTASRSAVLRFLFLSPSLVWESRPPQQQNVVAAATDVVHAALGFMLCHVLSQHYVAVALRGTCSCWNQGDAACVLGWQLLTVAAGATIRFVAFYSFWHCAVGAVAHLGGAPDRNLYGPW
jgi:hypothetical protein